jgi:membrane-bound serine protease (ClpP class)
VSLVISALLAFLFLDGPWRWVLIAASIVWEGIEIWIFLRWRGVRSTTGHEAMIGMKGRAVTDCRPEGQARIKGQLWRVICRAGASRGDHVRVVAIDGITLTVEPVDIHAEYRARTR